MSSTLATDREYMAQALRLARRGLYTTMPNPRVGCVIVKDNQVIAEGWHERAGQAHAEIMALQAAGAAARGATVYVTLEPCSHTGKTPPCCDALINAGVARVVTAMEDPNPQVCGSGVQRLRAAGIVVDTGLLATEAQALNAGFIKRMRTGLPLVRVKMASSLDGRTAMASGESQWITGAAARADVQRWRAQSCAIITGAGTVLADDPALTVRDIDCGRQPLRVVLDSEARVPAAANIFTGPGNALRVTALAQAEHRINAWILPDTNGRVDLLALLRKLGELQCNEVLVEAGATLAGAFLAAGLVDEIIIYQAPVLLGATAQPLFGFAISSMQDKLRLKIIDRRNVGDDLRIIAQPDRGE